MDANWILAVYAENHHLKLAFFSGSEEPNLDYEVVRVGHELCGTYWYMPPEK